MPDRESSNSQLPSPRITPSPTDDGWSHRGDAVTDKSNEVNTTHQPTSAGGDQKDAETRWMTSLSDRNKDSNASADKRKRSIGKLASPVDANGDREKVLKLSPAMIQELANSPKSIPVRAASPLPEEVTPLDTPLSSITEESAVTSGNQKFPVPETFPFRRSSYTKNVDVKDVFTSGGAKAEQNGAKASRPHSSRAASSPVVSNRPSAMRQSSAKGSRSKAVPAPLDLRDGKQLNASTKSANGKASVELPSPMPSAIPLPPMSLPMYLQLELSSDRPSPLYIHRSANADFPYESSAVKFERLLNFIYLPAQLEQVLWFGALACLDAWLYTFTILPLRFFIALWIWLKWSVRNAWKEVYDLGSFVYQGLGRMRERRKQQGDGSLPPTPAGSRRPSRAQLPTLKTTGLTNGSLSAGTLANGDWSNPFPDQSKRHSRSSAYRHRRTKSTPSVLLASHKADLLRGLLILTSCLILMRFDASRMYHGIRGQAAIKLYVIYNVLEVGDRLFSALGQDVLECLLSKETLGRNAYGRSRIIRPIWMFMLALGYNVLHATALFYQVITLNVAVNSYSNALLTLLMSNQFVEIKGTVFKKFEKENLFQLTCADVVERFQLWLMLLIIALRNIVEVGGLSVVSNVTSSSTAGASLNATKSSIIPKAFTVFPKFTGQVLTPFLLVLGSEMLVDWLKHCYITKFNNTKPALYGRFLDVLAKDYYSNAFAEQNLTKRIGLPVIPLSCLFIRASVQTYHMFLATHMPLPVPSASTSISVDAAGPSSSSTSPSTTAALAHIDHIIRRALGRSSFGAGGDALNGPTPTSWLTRWTLDDLIAMATMLVFFLVLYLVLLAIKLVLGMCLLSYARHRYRSMKDREKQVFYNDGRRVGGWGVVEVDDDKRNWIYADDQDGLRGLREKESRGREKNAKGEAGIGDLNRVERYTMAAKRIW